MIQLHWLSVVPPRVSIVRVLQFIVPAGTSIYENEPYETVENLIRFAKRGQNVLIPAWESPGARIKASRAGGLRARLDAMVPA